MKNIFKTMYWVLFIGLSAFIGSVFMLNKLPKSIERINYHSLKYEKQDSYVLFNLIILSLSCIIVLVVNISCFYYLIKIML